MASISDILDTAGIPHVGADHKHGRPGWVQVDCPWCGSDSGKFHLGISLTTGAASCWRCGKKNTAVALAQLCGCLVNAMRERLAGAIMDAPVVRKTGRLTVPAGVGDMLPGHRTYLTKRGFDADRIAALWGVRGIGQTARLAWRLFIPIYHHGEVVSWTTRSIKTGAVQRWVSAGYKEEAVHHKDLLYGADYAWHAIIIHEGPTDVWATGPGAVATCGTGFTEAQLLAMSRYACRVVCFDSEPAAQRRAQELANMLAPYPGTTHKVELETGKDPAEADPAEIAELRARFLGG